MSTMRDDEDNLLAKFNTRYRNKKYTNLVVSFLIVILGVSSFIYGLHLEPSYTIFRYMTVDGTLFTTFGSLVYIFVNIVEVRHNTELLYPAFLGCCGDGYPPCDAVKPSALFHGINLYN